MAIKRNIRIDQGTDFSAEIYIENDIGDPYDFTGNTVESQMRKNYAATNFTEFDAAHTNELGQIVLSLPKSMTKELYPGRYLYDVEVTDENGKTTRIVEGIATVTPGITR